MITVIDDLVRALATMSAMEHDEHIQQYCDEHGHDAFTRAIIKDALGSRLEVGRLKALADLGCVLSMDELAMLGSNPETSVAALVFLYERSVMQWRACDRTGA